MFLRPSVGNDSSQYGRVEGAVSGCRPAGPQNVGQVVSVCLACSHLSLFPLLTEAFFGQPPPPRVNACWLIFRDPLTQNLCVVKNT